ncbi:MAG: hypothetical protein EOO65_04760 [Methanosarcinales archaeon]|nr:MAG: hypothetical protein EOO65_04760 [Methanosarcinales archaeon]
MQLLFVASPLSRRYDNILGAVLSSYDADASKTRAQLLRVVAEIVAVSPALLTDPVRPHPDP